MRFRRFLSGLLTAALVVGLLVLPPASAAGTSGFTDIADARTADAAEMLRLLGVVDGTGGTSFKPGGTLTRAEFCKMTVEIMGRGDEEPAQRSRTIFTDVGPTYWARGYVNLASSITIGGGTGEDASAGTRPSPSSCGCWATATATWPPAPTGMTAMWAWASPAAWPTA